MRVIDRFYRYVRPFRFFYGWAKDAHAKMRCARRAEGWRAKEFRGARLDVCGGRNPLDPRRYLNVDIVPLPKVDLVFDIRRRFPIEDGVIAEIFSGATLEHFRKHDADHILREFFRVLKPGGTLRILQPDIEAIARGLLAGEDLLYINQHLFGKFKSDETDLFDVHKWMYTADALCDVLRKIGFESAERIPFDVDVRRLHDERYNFLIRAKK